MSPRLLRFIIIFSLWSGSTWAQSVFTAEELADARQFINEVLAPDERGKLEAEAKAGGLSVEEHLLNNRDKYVVGSLPLYHSKDLRADWHQIQDEEIKQLAASSVAFFLSSDVTAKASGAFNIRVENFGAKMNLCQTPEQSFLEQNTGPYCSGVMVGKDLIATAGHCVREVWAKGNCGGAQPPEVNDIRVVFGFFAKEPGNPGVTEITGDNIFRAAKVVDGDCSAKGADWALLKVEGTVPPSVASPVTRLRKTIEVNDPVFVLGYPSGLPLKYAYNSVVRDAILDTHFVANLDTFGGNSGSGVFHEKTKELVGLLVRGEADFVCCSGNSCYKDVTGYCPKPKCRKLYTCPSTGCRGEDVTKIARLPLP
jgi:hypothetical protein